MMLLGMAPAWMVTGRVTGAIHSPHSGYRSECGKSRKDEMCMSRSTETGREAASSIVPFNGWLKTGLNSGASQADSDNLKVGDWISLKNGPFFLPTSDCEVAL